MKVEEDTIRMMVNQFHTPRFELNNGTAFVMLQSKSTAAAITKNTSQFNKFIKSFTLKERQHFQFKNWNLMPAYFENDILWSELNFKQSRGELVSVICNFILFFLSVSLVTPVSLYTIVAPVTDEL